jgi:UPF0176 protein
MAFLAALRGDARFAGIRVKFSRSQSVPFARLKVRRRREIITFRREHSTPTAARAPALAPATLARWIERGADDEGRRLVLLDTRNREEVRHGTFAGALALPIDRFTDLPEALTAEREALADAAVVSFCTGGIRCEKAALWMQANGFEHVWQLDGGILGYFEEVRRRRLRRRLLRVRRARRARPGVAPGGRAGLSRHACARGGKLRFARRPQAPARVTIGISPHGANR